MSTATKEKGSAQKDRKGAGGGRAGAAERVAQPASPPPPRTTASPQPLGHVAVVLVHGMGEQRPMDTLRGLARTFVAGSKRHLWSVPDRYDCSFELHGFVVEGDEAQPQLDLFEGYWAAGMRGTTMTHVGRFARRVLLRAPSRVPARVRWLWWLLVASGLGAVGAATWIAVTLDEHDWRVQVLKAVGGLVLPAVTAWLCASLGDVARVVDSHPDNIEVRLATRNAIVGLLDKLHEGNRYDRIVVIGHSLGGLVAYDAVRLLWARRTRDWNAAGVEDTAVADAADAVRPGDGATREAFAQARGALLRQLGADGTWLVSDLVTVGSPVAYPDLFLAGTEPLGALIDEREVPTCPPQRADTNFRYPSRRSAGFEVFHHAAVFCATRWTNVYARGDFVGGPVEPPLGAAVQNIQLWSAKPAAPQAGDGTAPEATPAPATVGIGEQDWPAGRWSSVPVRSHTRYWAEPEGAQLLRSLVCREPTATAVAPADAGPQDSPAAGRVAAP